MRLSLVVVSIHCYWYISHVFLGIRAHRRKQKVIIRGGYSYSAYVTNCCHGWFVNSFLSSLAVRDGCKAIQAYWETDKAIVVSSQDSATHTIATKGSHADTCTFPLTFDKGYRSYGVSLVTGLSVEQDAGLPFGIYTT